MPLVRPGNMGSVIVSIVPGGSKQAMAKVAALLPSLTTAKKPVAVAVMGDEGPLPPDFVPSFRDQGVPVFRSPERALRAMARATAYGRQLGCLSKAKLGSGPTLRPTTRRTDG